jgi:peroxiredoxin
MMRKQALEAALLFLLASSAVFGDAPAKPAMPALKVGGVAPDFTLQYFDGNDLKKVALHDFRGKKNVMVGFYIFAFTGG